MAMEQEIDQGLRTVKIVWAAIFSSLAIFAVFGPLVGEKLTAGLPAQTFTILRTVLYVVSLGAIVGSRVLRRKMLMASSSPSNPPATSTAQIVRRYTAAVVVSLGLVEAVAIYGFILYILGKNQVDLYALILLAAAAMLLHAPKRSELLDLVYNQANRQA